MYVSQKMWMKIVIWEMDIYFIVVPGIKNNPCKKRLANSNYDRKAGC